MPPILETNNDFCRDSVCLTPDERLEVLASIFAEGFLYLAEHDLLNLDLIVPPEEGKCSNVPKRP